MRITYDPPKREKTLRERELDFADAAEVFAGSVLTIRDEPVGTAEVFQLRGRMSEAEYEREKKRLRSLYGDSSAEAAAKRDQAMADLFIRSGWTQEELAAKEGKDQSWVNRRLRFGRFLNFMPDGINAENLPNGLSEGRFRGFWDQTDKSEPNERIRFRAVHTLITESVTLRRKCNDREQARLGQQLGKARRDDG